MKLMTSWVLDVRQQSADSIKKFIFSMNFKEKKKESIVLKKKISKYSKCT